MASTSKSQLLAVPRVRQWPDYCGPSCVQMIARYYGKNHTQKEIAALAGTKKGHGTPAGNLVSAAKKMSFQAILKDKATWADLQRWVAKRRVPVIVNWFAEDAGHYSIVVGITATHVYVLNPEIDEDYVYLIKPTSDKISRYEKQDWLDLWFDFHPHHERSPKSLVVRRLIAIYK